LLVPTEFSADKIAAYLATDYRFGEGLDAITLSIDQPSPALQELFSRLAHHCDVICRMQRCGPAPMPYRN